MLLLLLLWSRRWSVINWSMVVVVVVVCVVCVREKLTLHGSTAPCPLPPPADRYHGSSQAGQEEGLLLLPPLRTLGLTRAPLYLRKLGFNQHFFLFFDMIHDTKTQLLGDGHKLKLNKPIDDLI